MLFNASDMNVLRKKISRCDELAERMRSAEAAGDQTDAAGAGLSFDAEMEWLGPECVTFCKQAIDEGIVRKAAAFDRLAEIRHVEISNQSHCGLFVRFNNADCSHSGAPTLLEAIEQLPTIER